MPNQHKPLRTHLTFLFCPRILHLTLYVAPLDDIRPHLEKYFHLGQSDKNIAALLQDHYDSDKYGLG